MADVLSHSQGYSLVHSEKENVHRGVSISCLEEDRQYLKQIAARDGKKMYVVIHELLHPSPQTPSGLLISKTDTLFLKQRAMKEGVSPDALLHLLVTRGFVPPPLPNGVRELFDFFDTADKRVADDQP